MDFLFAVLLTIASFARAQAPLPVSTVTGNGVSATGIVGTPIPGISASIGPCGIVASGFGHEISSTWCTTTQVAAGGGGAVGTVLPGSVIPGGGAQTVMGGGSVGSVGGGSVGSVGGSRTVIGGSATVGSNTVTGTAGSVSPTAQASSSAASSVSLATGAAAPQFTGAFGRQGMAVAALPLAIGAMMV